MKSRTLVLFLALVLTAAACGGSSTTAVPNADSSGNIAPTETTDDAADVQDSASASSSSNSEDGAGALTAEDVLDDAEESFEGLTETLENAQAENGGGTATLTVGDQSWTFNSVLCAVGEEEIGQEGASFVLSSLQDGKQMYFSIDETWGHSASLNDIKDFENPSVSLDSTGPYTNIELDGKNFSGTGEFLDGTSESFDRIPGTFSGTCP